MIQLFKFYLQEKKLESRLENVNHIKQFLDLGLPKNKCLIMSSGVMALFGIRKNRDLDVIVTKDVFNKLKNNKKLIYSHRRLSDNPSYQTLDHNVEFYDTMWPFKKSIEHYLKMAIVVKGVRFLPLRKVIRWKKKLNRNKDREDIRLIQRVVRG